MDNSHATPQTYINQNTQPQPTPTSPSSNPPQSPSPQPAIVQAPQTSGSKVTGIIFGVIGGFLAIGLVLTLVIYSLLSGKTGSMSPTLSYLQDKYGTDIEFTQTGVGGGGVDISSHLVYYTTPELDDRTFSVQYVKENGEITSICDDYLTYKFAPEVEKLYSSILKELNFHNFQIYVSGNNTCNHAVPTDNFSDYLRDPEADIYAIIYQPNAADLTIDKQAIADHFSTRLSELGFYDKTQAESTNADFARIIIISDDCTDTAMSHCSIKTYLKDFQISYNGYWNIKEDI